MKKIGNVLLALLPMIAAWVITILTSVCVQAIMSISYVSKNGVEGAEEYVMQQYSNGDTVMGVTMLAYVIITLIGLPVLVKGLKNKNAYGNPFKAFPGLSFPGIIFLFIGLELTNTCVMLSIALIKPSLLENYASLVQTTGMAGLTLISTLTTLVAAPICEELVFRGLIFTILEKGKLNFWVINTIQALLFGIYHLNVVQGIYAFVFGFVLGLVYKKYHSLWAVMLGHLVFNFSGTYIVSFLVKGDVSWKILIAPGLIAIAALTLGILALNFKKKEA